MELYLKIKIEEILLKLTKDDKFDNMTWVGRNYSIRDLKKDLKLCNEPDHSEEVKENV